MSTVLTPETDPIDDLDEVDIFLAGGITGCPNWQQEAINILQETGPDNLRVANPRRKNPIPSEGPEAMEQIAWEWRYLSTAPVILFWFAAEQTQPIALFELGKALGRSQRIAVGAHPEYPRRFDVRMQTLLEPRIPPFRDNLTHTVAAAVSLLDMVRKEPDQ